MASRDTQSSFRAIEVRAADAELAGRLAAEAHAAGATGLEERDCDGAVTLILYAPSALAEAVRGAVARAAPEAAVAPATPVPDTPWSEAWKAGLTATPISPRLLIRPSFVSAAPLPGRAELVVDPGQAFGTGAHASTRLALEWIDALAPALKRGARVLDVGTGTGILSLAAAKLAAVDVFAFDTDPLATAAARANARANGLGERLRLFVGGLEAIRAVAFDLVVANLLSTEALPLLAAIAARVRAGGHALFSGLLEAECASFGAALHAAGLRAEAARSRADADGEVWSALLTTR